MNVVITGVSRGLGAALFDALYARGDRLLAIGRTFTDGQRRLADAQPERVVLHRAELADPTALPTPERLGEFLAEGGHPPDAGPTPAVLLHNAAVAAPIGAVGTLAPAELATAVTVNLTAPLLLTNAFLAVSPRPARVLFVSSGAARRVVDGFAVYCTTKAGAEMFFQAVASQYAADPEITVTSVNPGQMDTGMQADIRHAGATGAYFPDHPVWVDRHARGEMADPVSVARRIITEHLF